MILCTIYTLHSCGRISFAPKFACDVSMTWSAMSRLMWRVMPRLAGSVWPRLNPRHDWQTCFKGTVAEMTARPGEETVFALRLETVDRGLHPLLACCPVLHSFFYSSPIHSLFSVPAPLSAASRSLKPASPQGGKIFFYIFFFQFFTSKSILAHSCPTGGLELLASQTVFKTFIRKIFNKLKIHQKFTAEKKSLSTSTLW